MPGQYTYTITLTGTVTPPPDSTPSHAHTVPPLTQQITFNVGDSVTIANPVLPTQLECTPQRALFSKALQLFPKIPSNLHSEMTWTDSSTVNSCSSTIPVELDVLTRYRVIGDTTYNGNAALQIEKTATFSAHGEGNQAQHRILLSASGTEIGTLYVDPNAGQLLGSATIQNAKIDITTSGRVSHFTQQTTETAIRL